MKKLLSFIKFAIIGIIWTIAFLQLSRWLLKAVWNFDILYKKQWVVMARYWNDNGVIVSSSDYLLFLTLLLLFCLWLFGWKWLVHFRFSQLLLVPLQYINNYQLRKYEQKEMHIALKNMSVGEKLTVEDVINGRLKKEEGKPQKKASDDLRQNISQKIIQKKDKE